MTHELLRYGSASPYRRSHVTARRFRTRKFLAPRLQPDIDIRDDVTRFATLGPAFVLAAFAAFAAFARFPQTAHGNTVTARRREDADDVVVAAPRPDDPVGAIALHAVHRPAPRDQHVARHDHDAIDRHDILVLDRLGVDVLRSGVSVSGAARETQRGREDEQLTFH